MIAFEILVKIATANFRFFDENILVKIDFCLNVDLGYFDRGEQQIAAIHSHHTPCINVQKRHRQLAQFFFRQGVSQFCVFFFGYHSKFLFLLCFSCDHAERVCSSCFYSHVVSTLYQRFFRIRRNLLLAFFQPFHSLLLFSLPLALSLAPSFFFVFLAVFLSSLLDFFT